MVKLLIIGLGGAAGAMARYLLGGLAHRVAGDGFPVGTLLVNVLGCFAIGVLAYLIEDRQLLGEKTRVLVQIGFLGSLTTFSTFGHETFAYIRDREMAMAAGNVLANVVLAMAAVWGGWTVAKAIWA